MLGVRTSRRRLIPVLTAALGFTLAGCSGASVPLPADGAEPEQVVQVYANAVHAADCETAEALVTGSMQSWCGVVDITSLRVTGTTQERKETDAAGGPMIQRVWVELTSHGSDPSLPDGSHTWSFLLDRTGPAGAWRIYDQGVG